MPAYTEKIVSDRDLTDIYVCLEFLPSPKPAEDFHAFNEMKARQYRPGVRRALESALERRPHCVTARETFFRSKVDRIALQARA